MISGPTTRSLPLPPGQPWHAVAPMPSRRHRDLVARRPKPMLLSPLRADEPYRTALCWAVVAAGAGALATLATLALRFAGAL